MPVKIIIFTPLPVEYNAVRKHLVGVQHQITDECLYEIGRFLGWNHSFEVIIRLTGATNSVMAAAAGQAILRFNPNLAFLVGIAGGVKDVEPGDVVVATKAYSYDSGKETSEGFLARPDVVNYSKELLSVAQLVSRQDRWRGRTADGASNAKVYHGALASGEKVVTTRSAEVYRQIQAHLNDTLALEMEAIGFGHALANHPHIRILNIRAISDLLDNKLVADRSGNQERAADHAAAFTFELLSQFVSAAHAVSGQKSGLDNKTDGIMS